MNREWLTQVALAAGLMLASQVCGATTIVRPNVPVSVEQSAQSAIGADSAPNDSARTAAAAALLCDEAKSLAPQKVNVRQAATDVLGRAPTDAELNGLVQRIYRLPQCSAAGVIGEIQALQPAIPIPQAQSALLSVLPAVGTLTTAVAGAAGTLTLTESELPKSAPEQESLQIARLLWATTNGSYQPSGKADIYVPGAKACAGRQGCEAQMDYIYRITRVEARNPLSCVFRSWNWSFRPCFQINARLLSNASEALPMVENWVEAHSLPSPLLSEVLYSTAKRDLGGNYFSKQPTRAEVMDEILKSRRISENLAAVAVGPLFGRSDENESFTGAAAFFYPDNRGWLLGSQNFYQRMSLVVGYGSLKSTDEAIGLAGSAYAFGVGVDITPGLLLTGTLLVPDGRLTPENGAAGSGGDDSTRLMLGLSINSNILAQIGL